MNWMRWRMVITMDSDMFGLVPVIVLSKTASRRTLKPPTSITEPGAANEISHKISLKRILSV